MVLDLDDPAFDGKSLRMFLSPVTGRQYEGETRGASILISDVTELKRAEGIRSEFTANVSHELKTPLTSIKGFTDMLSSGMVKSEEDRKRFLTMIGVEVDRLIELINDILKISELESVAIDQCEEASDVLSAAKETQTLLEPAAKEAGVSLTVTGESAMAAIPVSRLKELLLNLMENGVKYNVKAAAVNVTVSADSAWVTAVVADTGIGIPADAQKRVFERFFRVDKGRARKKRRHRPGAGHRQAHRPALRRYRHPGECSGRGQHLYREAAQSSREERKLNHRPRAPLRFSGAALFCTHSGGENRIR